VPGGDPARPPVPHTGFRGPDPPGQVRRGAGAGRLDDPPMTTVGTPDGGHRSARERPDPGVGHEMVTFVLLRASGSGTNTQRTAPSADRE
jgi:hypothetical protein